MADRRISLDRAGYGLLSRTLAECGRDAATGELRVCGRPGGTFHLRGGRVVAAESPGAPGPEALLLRSGRISGEQWDGLLREPGAGRWPEAGLIAHGYAGAAQLRVVRMSALQDAVFAIVVGRVEGVRPLTAPSGAGPLAPVAVGETPLRLLQEATRKLTALAALPCPVLPDRERPAPVPGATPDDLRLPPARRELLTHADGRRTARDLAFVAGRGVYPVTVEVARMLAEGLLHCTDIPPTAPPVPVHIPSTGMLLPLRREKPAEPPEPCEPPEPPKRAGGPEPGEYRVRLGELVRIGELLPPEPVAPAPSEPSAHQERPVPPERPPRQLPRRLPGASGINETLAATHREASWKGFFRLRHRVRAPDPGT
ncbi:MarR family transcriptional regulator [Streptomyces sp. CRN 30]|uniref:MarR family transcriptional regulator n=1 Tax=Streptomyces sp. CRN 30 TaxID=3075613 RepID=UPI002A82714B|nr:MarR family transcriptional regulator [Streptomyces sp. CRN 30]